MLISFWLRSFVPGTESETVHTRHFQIEKDKDRQRIFRSVGIFTFACEIRDCFFSIANDICVLAAVVYMRVSPPESE